MSLVCDNSELIQTPTTEKAGGLTLSVPIGFCSRHVGEEIITMGLNTQSKWPLGSQHSLVWSDKPLSRGVGNVLTSRLQTQYKDLGQFHNNTISK